ncbi:hypothetical protein GCM10022207_88720 [Streptomyces lannensis]|uniref:Uncharacterized protein n=2 Tax=Streptomyces TaxID=1883 RepID=A0ABP7LSZ6_9ACTN
MAASSGTVEDMPLWEFTVNGLDTRTAVLLLAGAVSTYVAFVHPPVGVALLVGLAVIGLLNTLMR